MLEHTQEGQHAVRSSLSRMQVVLYIDGVRIGEASASGDTPHHIIHRLCEIDMDMAGDMQQSAQQGVGFKLKLPELQQGRHEVQLLFCTIPKRGCAKAQKCCLALWQYCSISRFSSQAVHLKKPPKNHTMPFSLSRKF